MSKPLFKYVNATGQPLQLPGRGGGRVTLRDGEYVTDPYYEFLSREPGDPQPKSSHGGRKLLLKIPLDQDVEAALMAPVSRVASPSAPKQPTPAPVYSAPSNTSDAACATSCEATCMTMQEVDEVTQVEDINAIMDQEQNPETSAETSTGTEEASVGDAAEASTEEPAQSLSSVEATTPDHVGEEPTEVQGTDGADAEGLSISTVEDVLKFHGFSNTDVKEVDDHVVTVDDNGKDKYLSRLELGWSTDSKRARSRHVNKVLGE